MIVEKERKCVLALRLTHPYSSVWNPMSHDVGMTVYAGTVLQL